MVRRIVLIVVASLLLLIVPLSATASRAADPVVRHQTVLKDVTMPGQFDMIMRVLEFPAGSGAAPHTHAGPVLNIVLEGAIVLRRQGNETEFKIGQDWVDPADLVHDARNTGTTRGNLLATFLVPRGMPVSAAAAGGVQPPLPAPTTRSEVKIEGFVMLSQFDELITVVDFAPGASQPAHTHPGPALNTVREGTFTVRNKEGVKAINTGESWVEMADTMHEVTNTGTTPGTLMVTQLVPKGAAPTTTTGPVLPNTGGGGGTQRTPTLWLLIIASLGLGTGVWVLLRTFRRA